MERKTEAMSDRRLPTGVELLHQLDRIPHQADTRRERGLEVVVTLRRLADRDAEEPVEGARGSHVLRHDPDRVEARFHPSESSASRGWVVLYSFSRDGDSGGSGRSVWCVAVTEERERLDPRCHESADSEAIRSSSASV